ncbi:MAG: GNAT family N-acetyltransferase [Chitinophagaceae bacterium]
MKLPDEHKLDNPAWHALSETHQHLALNFGNIKCYQPSYSSFGGFQFPIDNTNYIDFLNGTSGSFYLIGEYPAISSPLFIKKELVCLQMVINHKIDLPIKDDIIQLQPLHAGPLFNLQNKVQPGYFKSDTNLLGNYYGIFKNDQLVASTGERMKMNAITEVSGVVTHPLHVGKGYAAQLVTLAVNNILDENKNACLHVVESNTAAISLYQKLGFTTRRKISFWQIATTA